MNALMDTPNLLSPPNQNWNDTSWKPNEEPSLLQGVIESLIDGVLILTEQSKLVYANRYARHLCDRLIKDASRASSIPNQIWHLCQALIDSRNIFPGQPVMLEDEVGNGKSDAIRIRVRWIELDKTEEPYLLVMMEDRYQSARRKAIAEGQRYKLTAREAEVWLYRCMQYTYDEIAAQLHITVNTVKKHVKSINAKRETFLYLNQ
ncbi:MAG: helix-turn-helix transcriptional regulator [Elainellaceae cyanobacterium]